MLLPNWGESSHHEDYAPAQRCINGARRMEPYGCAERVRPHPGKSDGADGVDVYLFIYSP
jgi:hypothetical protein